MRGSLADIAHLAGELCAVLHPRRQDRLLLAALGYGRPTGRSPTLGGDHQLPAVLSTTTSPSTRSDVGGWSVVISLYSRTSPELLRLAIHQQSLPHHAQTLPHSEVKAEINRALRPPTPEPPRPPRPSAVFALAPFVDTVLPQQHKYARKQPQQLFFEFRWRYLLVSSELVDYLLKVI
jgi:hypothetical protein